MSAAIKMEKQNMTTQPVEKPRLVSQPKEVINEFLTENDPQPWFDYAVGEFVD